MSTGPGKDRRDLQSYNPEAFNQSDDPHDMMGCHVGGYAGLNISNPQPGFFYAWADDSRKGQMLARLNGYHEVKPGDPESAAYKIMMEDHQELDSSSHRFPGLVLVRRSAKDERRIRKEEQVRRDDLLRSGVAERGYLHGGSAQEIASGGTRLMRDTHRTFTTVGEHEDSMQVESWTPDRGISSS